MKWAQEMRRKVGDLYYTGDEMPWMCFGLMRLAVSGDRVQELQFSEFTNVTPKNHNLATPDD